MKKFGPQSTLAAALVAAVLGAPAAMASPAISGGVWFNYTATKDNATQDEEKGALGGEALILYINDAPEGKPYSFDAEVRYGPGAFTDPSTNSTGDNFGIHQAEIGYKVSETGKFAIGKTAVPFGWVNVNFWPGDMLMLGYGDQMDVGVKYSDSVAGLSYNLAYFHADDWGETSTDTMDDNFAWGSSTTYRKVQTLVADASYGIDGNQKVGLSVQAGKLQDLTNPNNANEIDGSHSAIALYYEGSFDAFSVKGELLKASRNLPDNYVTAAGLADDNNETKRAQLELGYAVGDFNFYLDANMAKSDDVDTVKAFAPGVSYNYGPGWVYVEYLSMDGYIGSDNDVIEGDFDAAYVTVDYYF
ncbi:hypothetical protein [Oceanobacter mangrovi]|uniref:hypothetical protein n=1 Tax=Oceanobacter mangrovi TaxID=2862510 RepID=UPI001C8EAE98|nr:hypothetical protein [Oceanobacter mangrovi]